ncbi:MAG: polysaccharide biosynthesis C-terminal domain-containing protein [Sphingomonadales bacterium]|nr:polysaccharide biosynthesis C-terminal domain-containing protein [Sphingomonadales bacterium]
MRGGVASLGGFGARLTARVGLMVAAGHLFGASELGKLAQVAATIEILSAIGVLGLKRTLLGMLSRDAADAANGGRVERRVAEALLAAGLISLVLTAGLWLFWPLLFSPQTALPLVLLLAIPSIVISDVALTATRYHRLIKWEVLTRCGIEPWSYLLFALLAAWAGLIEGGLLYAYVGSLFAALVFALCGLLRVFGWRSLWSEPPRLRSLLAIPRESLPTGLTDIGVVLLRRVDILLVAVYTDPATTGVYFMVQQIATVPHKIHALFEPMLAPVIAALHHSKRSEAIQAKLAGCCRWVMTLQLGLSVPLIIFGDHVLGLFGPEFAIGLFILAIILLAELLDGSFVLCETALVFAKPSVPPQLILMALIVEVVAITLLAPPFGAEGAAFGFLIATFCLAAGRLIAVRRLLGIRVIDRSYLYPALLALATAVILSLARQWSGGSGLALPLLLALTGIAGFMLAIRKLATTREDRLILRRLRRF